jgi:hypothetical protein
LKKEKVKLKREKGCKSKLKTIYFNDLPLLTLRRAFFLVKGKKNERKRR